MWNNISCENFLLGARKRVTAFFNTKKKRTKTLLSRVHHSFDYSRIRSRLFFSKLRRLYLCLFRMDYVKDSIARRKGECKRCGACCRLFLKCHRLVMEDDQAHCSAYNKFRTPNCHMFPIDKRDLADRDLVSPDNPCGYWWDN